MTGIRGEFCHKVNQKGTCDDRLISDSPHQLVPTFRLRPRKADFFSCGATRWKKTALRQQAEGRHNLVLINKTQGIKPHKILACGQGPHTAAAANHAPRALPAFARVKVGLTQGF